MAWDAINEDAVRALGLTEPGGLFPSTPARIEERARRSPRQPAYAHHDGTEWRKVSWADYRADIRRVASALLALGVEKGDAVCILGFNSPEWAITAHGAMMIGARPAGIYWTSAPAEIRYVLEHSAAPVALVQTEAQAEALADLKNEIPTLRHIAVMAPEAGSVEPSSWSSLLAKGRVEDEAVDARLAALDPEDIATLIYTSGTTGPPKAVMLSHRAIAWTADVLCRAYPGGEDSRGLSYLPMAHIAEQQASVHCHPIRGGLLYFARSMETLAEDIEAAQPTAFFGVPRVWEKMADGIKARAAEARGLKKRLLDFAMTTNAAWHEGARAGRAPGPVLKAQKALADRLVTAKIKGALGLSSTETFISGAAPISPSLLSFFDALDMPIIEGYGQSETAAPLSSNLAGAVRPGSVGRVFSGIDWRIAEDGELQVRGPGLFSGYMNDPAATKAAHTADGWLRTGDIVSADEEGFLTIRGRSKDIIITSGGKNVTPSNIETDLMTLPLVEHAVVVGDGRHYLAALLTLSDDGIEALSRERGTPIEGPDDPALQKAVQTGVDAVNARHARAENIRRFALLDGHFTVEGGELTPTMKVKRAAVLARHDDVVRRLYAAPAGQAVEEAGS